MRLKHADPLPGNHEDLPVLKRLEAALRKRAGKRDFAREIPLLIRQAIDEVIDTTRTGRVHGNELEKTEKTYIGTKVEIVVRNYFHLPQGVLDLRIDDMDVDVKNTLGDGWMIPREAIGKPCILVASDEDRRACYFGLFVAWPKYLSESVNQDKKHSVLAEGKKNIHWLVFNQPYPPSFWSELGDAKTHAIMRGLSGNERVETLFREAVGVPVHRDIILDVAQQKDAMRRVRKSGGARDKLRKEGIALLSRKYDAALILELGLPELDNNDQFISVKPETPQQIELLRSKGKIA